MTTDEELKRRPNRVGAARRAKLDAKLGVGQDANISLIVLMLKHPELSLFRRRTCRLCLRYMNLGWITRLCPATNCHSYTLLNTPPFLHAPTAYSMRFISCTLVVGLEQVPR